MKKKLPLKLQNEPIIDAVFEIRFNSTSQASTILPGVLFNKYNNSQKKIENLPSFQIPEPIRAVDPNLMFVPVIRLSIDSYAFLIGDKCLALGCKLPYPGWTVFKPKILEILNHLKDSGIVQSVLRYSLKYVDLISQDILADKSQIVELDLEIGGHKVTDNENFQIKTELRTDGIINIIQIISNATFQIPGMEQKTGFIVDIDSIVACNNISLQELVDNIEDDIEKLHDASKTLFFSCLKQKTIDALGPTYANE